MNRSVLRAGLAALLIALVCAAGSRADAQGGTSLSGTVVDVSGAVIPGADISAKHAGTGIVSRAVSNSEGQFSIPSLPIGTYVVTVTLSGFKTVVINNVVLTAGAGANVKAAMEVGGVSEQVTVSSTSEIVQTLTSGVSTTVNTNQITKLPLTTRSAMDFVNMLPGVSTPSGNRNATVNGLARTAINITLDGVNIQDNTNKGVSGGDGFFAIVSPRLDAIEEVTVSSAGQGADATGNGAVQIKFTTRSGTNSFSGSGYEYYRSDRLNANTWFNNRNGVAKPKLKQNQTGFRVGGPIVIPGLYDGHNKAFFFANYEELRQPSDTTRNRNVLNTAAQNGQFSYAGGSVNVLALAAANGQVSTVDPTIGKLLSDIRAATGTTGSIAPSDVNIDRYTYNVSVTSFRRFPTASVDYNITNKHRYKAAWNYNYFTDSPDTLNNADPSFPGFAIQAGQGSTRYSFSNSVRSTLSNNFVNEARVAYSGAPVKFFTEFNPSMFENQKGFFISFPTVGSALQAASPRDPGPSSRNASTLDIGNTLTWLKGAHSVTLGGTFSNYGIWLNNSSLVPRLSTGLVSGDPALGLFVAANFPGASTANVTAARDLYAFLTGRVSSITADARIDQSGQYVSLGTGVQRGGMMEYGGFVQDQWRWKQNLTINAGIRYDIQSPFSAANSSYTFGDIANICGVSGAASSNSCNLFQQGNMPGQTPVFQQYKEGVKSFKVDRNNFAPSAGISWVPQTRPGFLGPLMGGGDFVVRAGYARAFTRPALGDLTAIFNNNPGITIPLTRNDANGQIIPAGTTAPLLLRNGTNLAPATFDPTPKYPIIPAVTQSIAGFDPNVQMAYSDSIQAGITRSLGKSMALEVRYVGTQGHGDWNDLNYNQANTVENGFLKEFRLAQANLQANIAAGAGAGCIGRVTTAGCQNNFAFTGAPGTAPLPIFVAYYNAVSAANAGNAALYTGTNWTNTTFLGFLAALNPNPGGFASNNGTNGLYGNSTFRSNALTAGLPANFFVANPNVSNSFLRTNLDDTKYNSLQIELRRRLSQGVQFQSSYVFGRAYQSNFFGFRHPEQWRRDSGDPGDLNHQLKGNVVYELPFGRGRRFGTNSNAVVERLIGGWQIGLAANINSGRLVNLGNVRLVGMNESDVSKMFKLRFDDAGKQLYNFPQDVIDNTILAFAVSPTTASGYAGASPTGRYFKPANGPDCIETEGGAGDCGTGDLVVSGPLFQQYDIRVSKRTAIVRSVNFEVAAEMLNAFNHANFTPVAGVGSSTIAGYQLTGLQGTNTARVVQIVMRVNW
jgi:outer membrane receptor protein involved in Fe transport